MPPRHRGRRHFVAPRRFIGPRYAPVYPFYEGCPPGTYPAIVDGMIVDCRSTVMESGCPPGTARRTSTMQYADGTTRTTIKCMPLVPRALGAVPEVALAMITWPGSFDGVTRAYQLSLDDVLWMARMARCEGGTSPAASLWTITQRFVASGGNGTLADFARAFSKCINPRWRIGGDLCIANPVQCAPDHDARRAAAASIPWEELPEDLQRTALLWATARLDNNVPKATNFGNPEESQACIERGSCSRVVLDAGNWYMSTPASDRWATNYVTMRLGDRVAGSSSSVWGLLAGLLLAGGAIVASRKLGKGDLGYPDQPCGLDYESFRSGWKYKDAYEFIAFQPESKGVSQRAVLREMRKLKQAEYERYLSDCEQQAEL